MKKPNLISNLDHPIHDALEKLHATMLALLSGVRSPHASRARRATARAIIAVEMAETGQRRSHDLWVAIDSLIAAHGCVRVLFVERKVSAEIVDEARRHLDRVLTALARLDAAGDHWPTFELSPLANPPKDLPADPIIKRLRAAVTHANAVLHVVRERELRAAARTGPRRTAA
jgi:hypothetical protein